MRPISTNVVKYSKQKDSSSEYRLAKDLGSQAQGRFFWLQMFIIVHKHCFGEVGCVSQEASPEQSLCC